MKNNTADAFRETFLTTCSLEALQEKMAPDLRSVRRAWVVKLEEILRQRNLDQRQFAMLCAVSEATVRQWLNGELPQSRDQYIRIGLAAGYNLEEMNAFLQHYGQCPALYVKTLEDSVCMFVLQSDELPHT